MHMAFCSDKALLVGFSGGLPHAHYQWSQNAMTETYMPDATHNQHPKPRNEVRTRCFVREGRCRKKGWDTVGQDVITRLQARLAKTSPPETSDNNA